MAFLADDPNKQDPNDPNNANGVAGQGTSVASGAPTASLGGSSAPITGGSSSSNSPAGTSSGSFTNLNNYLSANQGNDSKIAGDVTNTVKTSADTADAAGKTFGDTVTKSIGDNTITEDPNLRGQLSDVQNTSGADASKINGDEFTKEYGATWKGPQDTTDDAKTGANWGATNQAYVNTQQLGKLAGQGTAGQQTLLQDTYGKGGQQYTPGEQLGDSFILGASSPGAQAIQNIGSQYGNYTDKFNGINSLLNTQIGAARDTTNTTGQNVQKEAGNAYGGVQGRLDQANVRAGNDNTAAQNDYKALVAETSPDQQKYLVGPTGRETIGNEARGNDIGNYQRIMGLINGAGGAVTSKYTPDQFVAGTTTGATNTYRAPAPAAPAGPQPVANVAAPTVMTVGGPAIIANGQLPTGNVPAGTMDNVAARPQIQTSALNALLGINNPQLANPNAFGTGLMGNVSTAQGGSYSNSGIIDHTNGTGTSAYVNALGHIIAAS